MATATGDHCGLPWAVSKLATALPLGRPDGPIAEIVIADLEPEVEVLLRW